jgi:pentatricopeptide repeat protein
MDETLRKWANNSLLIAKDFTKSLQVGALLLADTLNSAFNMAWIYNILINHFGKSQNARKAKYIHSFLVTLQET